MIGVEYRTYRRTSKEDADDPTPQVLVEMIRHPWLCPRCFYHNGKWDDLCGFCKWDRADEAWLCGECGHLNPKVRKECELCGRTKEE